MDRRCCTVHDQQGRGWRPDAPCVLLARGCAPGHVHDKCSTGSRTARAGLPPLHRHQAPWAVRTPAQATATPEDGGDMVFSHKALLDAAGEFLQQDERHLAHRGLLHGHAREQGRDGAGQAAAAAADRRGVHGGKDAHARQRHPLARAGHREVRLVPVCSGGMWGRPHSNRHMTRSCIGCYALQASQQPCCRLLMPQGNFPNAKLGSSPGSARPPAHCIRPRASALAHQPKSAVKRTAACAAPSAVPSHHTLASARPSPTPLQWMPAWPLQHERAPVPLQPSQTAWQCPLVIQQPCVARTIRLLRTVRCAAASPRPPSRTC